MLASLWVYSYSKLDQIRSKSVWIINFHRYCQIVLEKGYGKLHWCQRVCERLTLIVVDIVKLNIFSSVIDQKQCLILICLSLVIRQAEHIFGVFATCVCVFWWIVYFYSCRFFNCEIHVLFCFINCMNYLQMKLVCCVAVYSTIQL